jgi:hypothetical protein
VSSSNDPVDPSDKGDPQQDDQRQTYEKPSFVREQVFETMALACGKINPTSGQCRTVKKVS